MSLGFNKLSKSHFRQHPGAKARCPAGRSGGVSGQEGSNHGRSGNRDEPGNILADVAWFQLEPRPRRGSVLVALVENTPPESPAGFPFCYFAGVFRM